MNKKIIADETILFFAFRYALGRKTTAPSIVIETIMINLKELSTHMLQSCIREINECNNYGMDVDKRNWMNLKNELKKEIRRRILD